MVTIGDRAQVHVEGRDLAPEQPEHREPGVEAGEHQDRASRHQQGTHDLVEVLGERVGVSTRPEQVVTARRQAHQAGRHGNRLWDLFLRDLPQHLAPHREVGVPQPGLLRGQHLGETVRPAPVALQVGPGVIESLGETVPQRDKGADLPAHPVSSTSPRILPGPARMAASLLTTRLRA